MAKCMKKMLPYTKTIIIFGQMRKSSSKVLLNRIIFHGTL